MAFEITTIATVKNLTNQEISVVNLENGKGRILPPQSSAFVVVDIPWMMSSGDATGEKPHFIRVRLHQSGQWMLLWQHDKHIYQGTNINNGQWITPESSVKGRRDLVVGDSGIGLFVEGNSPNLFTGRPAMMANAAVDWGTADAPDTTAALSLNGDA